MTPLLYTQDFIPCKPNHEFNFQGSWDIDVNQGDRICIYGDSGSGKSLFLKSLTLLYPPQSGHVYFLGKLVTSQQILTYRSKVIYLQQVPQFGDDTIAEEFNRVFKYKVYRNHQDQLQAEAFSLIEKIGLDPDIFSRRPYELSGGQKQKVHLILGLCLNPHILILDEPTASLDEKSTIKVERLLHEWVTSSVHKRAYIWVSHQASQRKRVASKFFHIQEGRLSSTQEDKASYSSVSV